MPRPYADAPRDRIAGALAVYADAADTSQAMLRSAGDVAAALNASSMVLSAASQATAHHAAAPRGRLEQHLLDLGVRDAALLRQGVELDQRARRVLARAHRAEPTRPQQDGQLPPGPDAVGVAAEVAWTAEAAADEPEAEDGPEIEPA